MSKLRKTKKDTDTLMAIHALNPNLPYDTIRQVMETLFKVMVIDYTSGEYTNIPYLGPAMIDYQGDIMVNGLKEAKLSVIIEASSTLKNHIGKIEDEEETDLEEILVEDNIDSMMRVQED